MCQNFLGLLNLKVDFSKILYYCCSDMKFSSGFLLVGRKILRIVKWLVLFSNLCSKTSFMLTHIFNRWGHKDSPSNRRKDRILILMMMWYIYFFHCHNFVLTADLMSYHNLLYFKMARGKSVKSTRIYFYIVFKFRICFVWLYTMKYLREINCYLRIPSIRHKMDWIVWWTSVVRLEFVWQQELPK